MFSSSVRWRLVLSYLIVALTTAIVVGAVTYVLVGAYFANQDHRELEQTATRIAARLRPFLSEPQPTDPSDLDRTVQALAFLSQTRVTVLDRQEHVLAKAAPSAQGMVWFQSGSSAASGDLILIQPGSGQAPSPGPGFPVGADTSSGGGRGGDRRPPEAAFLSPGSGNFRLGASPDELAAVPRSEQQVQVPVVDRNNGMTLGYVELSQGPAFGANVLAGLRLALLGGIGVAGLVALMAGLVTAREITAPLQDLGQAAENMAAGDLSARAPSDRGDEFGRLARQFNTMADRLSDTIAALDADRQALRHFIADASHELRTPLTALKTFNQVLRQSPSAAQDPQATFLAESAAQIDKLDKLTQGLLDLSRLQAGLTSADFITEDLRPMVGKSVESFRTLAETRQIKLALTLPIEPVSIRHDPTYLARALENLISNALKFTPPGGKVEVGLAAGVDEGAPLSGGARLWVADTGPGIDPTEVDQIFDRFRRGRAGQECQGTGLGLAIVRAVAEAHGGQVLVSPQTPHGARFEIRIPEPPTRQNGISSSSTGGGNS